MFHNSFDLLYKTPFGAVKTDTFVSLRFDVDKKYKACRLRLWTPDQREELYEMAYKNNYYEISIGLTIPGVYWYVFILEDFDMSSQFYGCEQGYTAGKGSNFSYFPRKAGFQITCYDKNFCLPSWYKGDIIYQIFPDRFARDYTYNFDEKKYKKIHKNWNEELSHTEGGADNFEFFGGNLQGIVNKLDYLEDLNIKLIYLNPIYKSISNHRYDVTTYMELDEMLGTIEDFKRMIKLCHERNIKVVLDVSWNHVGADSIYFNKYKTHGNHGAYNDVNSVYRSWFDIKADGSYASWWGIDTLPVLDKNNPAFKFYVSQVVEFWASLEIDGFRIDVIDELPDEFLEWFRNIVKGINKNMIIIGEIWDDASLKKDWALHPRSFLYGNSQDSVMNYMLRNLLVDFLGNGATEKEVLHNNIDAIDFYRKYMNLYSNYPKEIFYGLMNFMSTHDINRALIMFGDCPHNGSLSKEEQKNFKLNKEQYEIAVKRLKIAWSFIICSIGTPSLFYGDEGGLYGYNDPYNRKPMNWTSQDKELLDWFKEINSYRNKYPVTKDGEMRFVYAIGDVFAFERHNGNTRMVYIANRGRETKTLSILGKDFVIDGMGYKIEFLT
jgi:cyclomaltodextrinase / maltogenic alpha-amylase / neopullulanase